MIFPAKKIIFFEKKLIFFFNYLLAGSNMEVSTSFQTKTLFHSSEEGHFINLK